MFHMDVVSWAPTGPGSARTKEKAEHYHMVVETQLRCRWGEIAQYLRQANNIYASVATSSSRRSYWTAFAYLYAPNAKKTKEDLDDACVLSPGHETPPQQLLLRRQGAMRNDH